MTDFDKTRPEQGMIEAWDDWAEGKTTEEILDEMRRGPLPVYPTFLQIIQSQHPVKVEQDDGAE